MFWSFVDTVFSSVCFPAESFLNWHLLTSQIALLIRNALFRRPLRHRYKLLPLFRIKFDTWPALQSGPGFKACSSLSSVQWLLMSDRVLAIYYIVYGRNNLYRCSHCCHHGLLSRTSTLSIPKVRSTSGTPFDESLICCKDTRNYQPSLSLFREHRCSISVSIYIL